MEITVYGDSILKGVLLEDRRYVVNHEWERRFASRFGCRINNRSRFGCTIRKAMAVIRHDAEVSPAPGEPAVLELGGNDCDHDWAAIAVDPDGEHAPKTSPEQFFELYREAIGLVRRGGRIPVVMTLPPIHSENYLRFVCRGGLSRENIRRWLGDTQRIARWQESYSDLAAEAAEAEDAPLIDLRSAFPREQELILPLVGEDGIHPSRLGQWLIYRTLSANAGVPAAG